MSYYKKKGISIAAAVAVAFSAMPAISASTNSNNDVVVCINANACKGQGECRMPSNSCGLKNKCRGQNSCEKKGILMLSKSECVKRGGQGVAYTH